MSIIQNRISLYLLVLIKLVITCMQTIVILFGKLKIKKGQHSAEATITRAPPIIQKPLTPRNQDILRQGGGMV